MGRHADRQPERPAADDRFVGEPGLDRYDTERSFVGWLFEHRFNDTGRSARTCATRTTTSTTAPYTATRSRCPATGRATRSTTSVRPLCRRDDHEDPPAAGGPERDGQLRDRRGQTQTAGRPRRCELPKDGESASDLPVYYDGGGVALIDAYAPLYGNFTPPPFSNILGFTQRQLGVYAQDQMKFGANWNLMFGLRHDSARNETEGARCRNRRRRPSASACCTPPSRLVAVRQLRESFTPIPGASAVTNTRFKPQRGKQLEGGVKYERGRMTYTAALYDFGRRTFAFPIRSSRRRRRRRGRRRRAASRPRRSGRSRRASTWRRTTTSSNRSDAGRHSQHQAAIGGDGPFRDRQDGRLHGGPGWRTMSAFRDNQGGAGPEVPAIHLFDAMLARDHGPWRSR